MVFVMEVNGNYSMIAASFNDIVSLIDTSGDVFRTQPLLISMCSMYANI